MPAKMTNILIVGSDAYRAGRACGMDRSITQPYPTPSAALDAGGCDGGVTLLLPASWCLCASIQTAGLPRARQAAMLFRLEEELPLAAEDVVADFVESGERALGIAGQLRLLTPLVDAIVQAGRQVDSIVPQAMMAGQWYLQQIELPPCDVLAFECDGQIQLLYLTNGQLTGWDELPPDAADLSLELAARALEKPLRLAVGPLPVAMPDIPNVTTAIVDLPPADEAAMRMAQAAAQGDPTPLVELWRDPLGKVDRFRGARPAVLAAVVAGVLLVMSLFTVLLWRADAYCRLAEDYERQQRALFEKTFPKLLPTEQPSIATQLLREERRLKGLMGDGSGMPSRLSSLVVLRDVLAALPADGQCEVSELRLSDDKIWFEATVASHAEATAIATTLAAEKKYSVEPPRTERLANGQTVGMTLSAVLIPAKEPTR